MKQLKFIISKYINVVQKKFKTNHDRVGKMIDC